MNLEREKLIHGLYKRALDMDPRERQLFLERECRQDEVLCREVLSRIQSAEALEESPFTLMVDSIQDGLYRELEPGDKLGTYRILKELGQGGMGRVYLAEQETPFHRKVAIKVIKWGMEHALILKRFNIERHILAKLRHPFVAQVYDAGATPAGQPFFVMEFIEGQPITEYCDHWRLTVRERLELFVKVCQTIHHAHQKGIIHRDIKPNNVLIMRENGQAIPKIIDFGIAKVTGDDHTTRAPEDFPTIERGLTRVGQVMGSLGYMSPEQANITELDVDIRTDVYSLGVVLYELLAGVLPFPEETFQQAAWYQIIQHIRERTPLTPSSRWQSLDEPRSKIARNRRTDPHALHRWLRGDLDWITMKALEKSKERRYDSASQLAADVERYLRQEPVMAGPPTWGYRCRKFVKRHKVGVFATALLAASLIIGIVGTTLGLLKARREAIKSQTTIEFMQQVFTSVDPEKHGPDVKVVDLLNSYAENMNETLPDQPEIRATFHDTFAGAYVGLGAYDKAAFHARQALAIRQVTRGRDHPKTLDARMGLNMALIKQGKFEEAERHIRQTLRELRRIHGEKHPKTIATMNNLGHVLMEHNEYEQSETVQRQTLALRREVLGPEHRATLRSMNNLALLLEKLKKYEESEALQRQTLKIRQRTLGEDHVDTLHSLNNLATVLRAQKKYAESESIHRLSYEKRRVVMGETHPDTLTAMNNLGMVMFKQEKYGEAAAWFRRAYVHRLEGLGEAHPRTRNAAYNLARALGEMGSWGEAEPFFQFVYDWERERLGEDHNYTLITKKYLDKARENRLQLEAENIASTSD